MAFDPVRVGFGERSSLGVAPRWSRAAAIVLLVLGARTEPISEAVIACLTHGWRTGLSGWVDTALEDFVSLSKSPERVFDPLRTEPEGYGAAAEEEAAGQYPTAESSTVPIHSVL